MSKKQKFAFAIRTLNNPLSMLHTAKSDPELCVTSEQLDKELYKLNVQNGVIDLKTGQLLPHDPKYKMTKISPASYDAGAKAPLFIESMLYWMDGDVEMVNFLGRLIGMGLTGDTSEQKLVKLLGNGKNGKSVLLDVIMHIMGDYASITRPEVFLNNSGSIHNYIAEMKGSRFVFCSEFPLGAKVNTAFVKEITGGEKLKGRQLYQESITFKPEFLLMTSTNWPWLVEGEDTAILRRLLIIPFDKVVPDDKVDIHLVEKLKEESDGILSWFVKCCLDWQKNGLQIPQKVTEKLSMYASSMDMFGNFIDEMCIPATETKVKASDLCKAFNSWLSLRGEAILSQRAFSSIASRRFKPFRAKEGMYYLGINFKPFTHSLTV